MVPAGLCADCLHSRIVDSGRSTFRLCERSFREPQFPKYPRLPVLSCAGYEPRPPEPANRGGDDKLTG